MQGSHALGWLLMWLVVACEALCLVHTPKLLPTRKLLPSPTALRFVQRHVLAAQTTESSELVMLDDGANATKSDETQLADETTAKEGTAVAPVKEEAVMYTTLDEQETLDRQAGDNSQAATAVNASGKASEDITVVIEASDIGAKEKEDILTNESVKVLLDATLDNASKEDLPEVGDAAIEETLAMEEEEKDAVVQQANLSASVLADFSERSSRNVEVARLQTQLERSQLRRQQVEEVVAEELASLRAQLEREIGRERERAAGVAVLSSELESAAARKNERIEQEKRLLVQLQDVAQRTTEATVRKSVLQAVETKANLVAIEMLLVEDIAECLDQIYVERDEIERRLVAMRATCDSLPALDDSEALRLYSWSRITALEDELRRSAVAIAETDAKVSSLRERINDALAQRNAALGMGPLPKEVRSVDLTKLDDEELRQAATSSALATLSSIGSLARRTLATFGVFADSQSRQSATLLLQEASNTTRDLKNELDAAAASSTGIIKSEDLYKRTTLQIQQAGSSFGKAVAEVSSGIVQASRDTDLGQAAFDVVAAASNTAAAASVLGFRAIKTSAVSVRAKLRSNATSSSQQ